MVPVRTAAPPTRTAAPRPRAPRLVAAALIAATGLMLTRCGGNEILTPPTVSNEPPKLAPAVTAPPALVLVGAGEIARCDKQNDEATAVLLDNIPGTVFTTGNNVYLSGGVSGSTADFTNCFGPSWGRHKARIQPVAGDLDYQTANASGYFGYFGSAAGDASKGYYSYDIGEWHVIALNSNVDMSAGSAQDTWLKADLAANPKQCTAAYWHHPRFSSRSTSVRSSVKAPWQALYAAGADLVINAHYRLYERFAPQTPDGVADPTKGIRQFTVGTGGRGDEPFDSPVPNSEVRNTGTYGVLKLTLDAGSYTWAFVPVAGQSFTDTGSGACHRAQPLAAVASVAVTPASASVAVGSTVQLTATPKDAQGNPVSSPVTWASDKSAVATVSGSGLVTGVAAGSATITATSGGKSGTSAITVTAGSSVASVAVTPAAASVPVGSTVQLTATPKDAQGNPVSSPVTWASDKTAVATVSGSGLVAGVAAGSATITATSGGKSGTSAITVTASPPSVQVLVGAGDIADCALTADEATAALLDNIPGTVFTAGDNAYESGTADQYANCYDPTWGRHKARTHPTTGNHEYETPGASGYFGYFGAAAGDPTKGYYSYDLADWHVVAVNSSVSMAAGSAQEQWVRADLAGSTKQCTLAIWHHPMFTSANGRVTDLMSKPIWDALYAFGAELVINGHDHGYERFAPQAPDGTADPTYGIREIIAGTGGANLGSFGVVAANSQVRNNTSHGVLKLSLGGGSYGWEFVQADGPAFIDTGSGSCHGLPPSNLPPTARPGGPYASEAVLQFDGGTSSDPDNNTPLSFAWSFGDGGTGTGAAPSHSYTANGTYTVTLTVTDSRGAPSAPATTSATITNLPPVVDAGPDALVTAGATVGLSARFSDPGANDAPWTYAVDWGDGSPAQSGSTTSQASSITGSHPYPTPGQYAVRVTVTDKDGGSGMDDLLVTVSASSGPVVFTGAGNIAKCTSSDDERTATLLDNIPGIVFTTGNMARPSGSATDYANCYAPSWGRHKARTYPVLGEHEYDTGTADPTFDYFGARAGPRGQGYYSVDLGDWHVIVLNDNSTFVSLNAGSAQEQWLRADLAANTKRCTIALWYIPRFFSSDSPGYNSTSSRKALWEILYPAGVDVVVNSKWFHYERFAPQTPGGVADPTGGIREFIVGTGGDGLKQPIAIAPNSEARGAAYGVLKLTLGAGTYSWEFVPIAGSSFTDSGSGSCH